MSMPLMPLMPAFQFKDQYIQVSTFIDDDEPNIYGLGERVFDLRLDPHNQTYTIFTADHGTPEHMNLYGAQPMYVELRPSGNSHGVLLLNSNGMDVVITSSNYTGSSTIDFKAIGGIVDLFVMVGPSVDNVVQQFTRIVGRPYMIPYWSLGFHQCRWGYESIEEVAGVVDEYANAGIPLDTMWTVRVQTGMGFALGNGAIESVIMLYNLTYFSCIVT